MASSPKGEADEVAEDERPGISVKAIRERYNAGRREATHLHHQYWLNAAYLMGEQWLWVNPQTNQIDSLTPEPDRVRATVNHMLPFSRTLISNMNSKPLMFSVPPNKADDGTLRAARIGESILADLAREQDWESLREDASWAAWKGGVAAISLTWDTSKGTPLGNSPTTGRPFSTGDISPRVHSVVDFAIQPGVRNAERAAWWIDVIALPPETVQEHYDLEATPAADASAGMTPFQRTLFETSGGSGTSAGSAGVNLTTVLVYYERPSRKNSKGTVCHVVGNEIVREGAWPFPFKDRLNLVILKESRVDNKWWGVTVLSSGRSVQNGINQSWSSIIEHVKQAGNARLYVPESTYERMKLATDAPEMIPWPDGVPAPQWTQPAALSQWIIDQPERLKAELADIVGVHDVSRGEAPNNIQSGLGLSILVEQDSTPVGRMVREQASAWGRFATMCLQVYEKKATEPRTAVIKQQGYPPETVEWSGKELQGQTTAIVDPENIMPRSKAQLMQFAQTAADMGLLQDPAALGRFLRLAEIPSHDILEALAPDVAKARRENAMMFQGKIPDPLSMAIDDHNIHVSEHHTAMKSPRWDLTSPESQAIFRAHVQAHATLSAEELGRQLAKTEMSPVLASAADPNGAPVLPVGATGPAAGAADAQQQPGSEAGVQAAVQQQNPGIDPSVVQQGI